MHIVSFNIMYAQCRFYNDFLMILIYDNNHYRPFMFYVYLCLFNHLCLISVTTHWIYKITIFKIYYIYTDWLK